VLISISLGAIFHGQIVDANRPAWKVIAPLGGSMRNVRLRWDGAQPEGVGEQAVAVSSIGCEASASGRPAASARPSPEPIDEAPSPASPRYQGSHPCSR